jgi:exodeoxyribonuclease VII large subunit
LDHLTREISLVVRNKLGERKNELKQLTWKFRQETGMALQESDYQLERKLQKAGFLVNHYLFVRHQKIARARNMLDITVPRNTAGKKQHLDEYVDKFRHLFQRQLEKEKHRITIAAQMGEMSDPANILKKGYSITTYRGRLIKNLSVLNNEEMINTQFYSGSISSKIIEINNSAKNDN